MYYEEYKKGIQVNLNPFTFEIILLKSLIFHQSGFLQLRQVIHVKIHNHDYGLIVYTEIWIMHSTLEHNTFKHFWHSFP